MRQYRVTSETGSVKVYRGFNRNYLGSQLVAMVDAVGDDEVEVFGLDDHDLAVLELSRYFLEIHGAEKPTVRVYKLLI